MRESVFVVELEASPENKSDTRTKKERHLNESPGWFNRSHYAGPAVSVSCHCSRIRVCEWLSRHGERRGNCDLHAIFETMEGCGLVRLHELPRSFVWSRCSSLQYCPFATGRSANQHRQIGRTPYGAFAAGFRYRLEFWNMVLRTAILQFPRVDWLDPRCGACQFILLESGIWSWRQLG